MPDFHIHLSEWYTKNKRDLPWRSTKNPYFLWLSEVILQQTRALQGLPYYLKFTSQYPTIQDLATASSDDVMKTWQGLGYYSRARNLHATAQYITQELNGVFPNSYAEIIKLKGIGPYTAAAISSFAYGERKAVVDGNVYRVLSRYFNDSTPIDSTIGKKRFQQLADELIKFAQPAQFNQAIMELGATVCTPKLVKCTECPLNDSCEGFHMDTVYDLPIKGKKTKVVDRYLTYFIFKQGNETILKQRLEKDIWQGLYDFPLIDSNHPISSLEIEEYLTNRGIQKTISIPKTIKHILSHQRLHVQFIHINQHPPQLIDNERIVTDFENYALPRVIDKYLEQLK